MSDIEKSKKQLIQELNDLRRKIIELEKSSAETALLEKAALQRDEDRNPEKLLGVASDTTDRKLLEEENELISHLIQMISLPDDFRGTIQSLLSTLQHWSGCESVGIRMRDGLNFPYYETRGFPASFVQLENSLCACDHNGQIICDGSGSPLLECMCGNILSGRFDPSRSFFTFGGSFWTNSTSALLASTTEADRQARTRNRCHGEGYESVALVPLKAGPQVFGLLQFNDPRPGRFTLEGIIHFEKIAQNLANALARRQAEEALRKSEENFRAIFNNSLDGIFFTSPTGPIFAANPAACQMTGWSEEEICRGGRDLIVDTTDPGLNGALQNRKQTGRFHGELNFRRKDGTVFPVELSSTEFLLSSGELRSCIIFRDITKRKRANEAVQENEERYRRLFETENDAIFLVDVEGGRFLDANPSATRLYGYTWPELMTMRHRDISAEPEKTSRAVIDEQTQIFSRMHRKKDGTIFPVNITGSYFDLKGRRVHVAAIRDISAEKKLEEQLIQAREMKLLGQLTSGLAHEVRNPLNAILVLSEALFKEIGPNPEYQPYFDHIKAQVCRLSNLMKDLLDLGKPIQHENLENISVHNLVPSVQGLWKTSSSYKTHRLLIDLSEVPEDRQLKAELLRLQQVFINLLDNAAQHSPPGSLIKIYEQKTNPGFWKILIVDQGTGIPEKNLDLIFTPFFTTRKDGTGLGLSIVKSFLESMGGKITVRNNNPPPGCTVEISLPLFKD